MFNPLVSIIIPTYNRAHLIGETLDSIFEQTYTNWECIIVDDGSTDDTASIVADYVKSDARFQYHIRKDVWMKGSCSCRNIGILISKGEYFQFLDSDDIISSNKIFDQINIFNESSYQTFVFCKWGRFNKNINDKFLYDKMPIYDCFDDPILFLNNLIVSKGYLPIHSFLFPREEIDKVGLWDDKLIINQDGDYFSRIFLNFKSASCSLNSYVLYRTAQDENSITLNLNENKIKAIIFSWETIFKRYKLKFKGAEKKYRIYIKRGVYHNTKNFSPNLLSHSFFSELKFYFWKERLISFYQKLLKNK
ncbi:glycosyltransferase family 2 protein [Flavobacterium sp.]|uniref:glycosyltransferase family 2 protein n=1 Tax=Flavobacterium sp. TaxID=239 RepID=UPI0040471562